LGKGTRGFVEGGACEKGNRSNGKKSYGKKKARQEGTTPPIGGLEGDGRLRGRFDAWWEKAQIQGKMTSY